MTEPTMARSRLESPAVQLFLASFLGLFFELALIRFVNSTVQVVAYFNNFLILSAFLGLGFGSTLVPRRRDLFRLLPAALPAFLLLLLGILFLGYTAVVTDQVFWTTSRGALPVQAVMLVVFCANCAFFIPIGYKLGSCLARFDDRLEAYALDLGGSFAGVAAFTAVSFLGLPPWTWFAAGSALVLALIAGVPARDRIRAGLLLGGGVAVTALLPPGIWSPYYMITFKPYVFDERPVGFAVVVDQLRIQDALEFSPALDRSPLRAWAPYYRLPYRFRAPGRVLILGGGAGNDAAMALRFDPESIDVVEIDPALVRAGRTLHPEKPYADPRVRAVNNDARAFLRGSTGSWDLIVMNALDSHHQLPGLSTLRLESFIYTVEAFRDVGRRMTPSSIFVVHLSSTRTWMGQRLHRSLEAAFGRAPRLFSTRDSPFGSVAFVIGPDEVLSQAGGEVYELRGDARRPYTEPTELATDDWPHLYLEARRIPVLYLQSLVLIVLFTAAILAPSLGSLRRASHLGMFLLGAGFMLLETRSIAQSALLFGATWIVNAVVIGTILAVLFAGNRIVMRGWAPRKTHCWAGLFASLAAAYLVGPAFVLEYALGFRLAFAVLWIGAPIFFASLIFSHSFRDVSDTASAFGANLLGVVAGGAVEYSSMTWGLDSLYLTTAAMYLAALAVERAGRRARADRPAGAAAA